MGAAARYLLIAFTTHTHDGAMHAHTHEDFCAGCKALSLHITSLTNLQFLRLGTNNVGPNGAGAIVAAIAGLPKLTYLDLHSNALAAAGAAAIAPHINGLSSLQVSTPS